MSKDVGFKEQGPLFYTHILKREVVLSLCFESSPSSFFFFVLMQ